MAPAERRTLCEMHIYALEEQPTGRTVHIQWVAEVGGRVMTTVYFVSSRMSL